MALRVGSRTIPCERCGTALAVAYDIDDRPVRLLEAPVDAWDDDVHFTPAYEHTLTRCDDVRRKVLGDGHSGV